MRYIKGQKDETRERITATAARLFRRDGITATGIQGLMKACELTNGAFYGHFDSKDDLVEKALEGALAEHLAGLERSLSSGPDGLVAAIRDYLSLEHINDAGGGCPTAALASEVARSSPGVRATYTRGLANVFEGISRGLPLDAHTMVPAIFAMLVGCVQLARASSDPVLAEKVLSSGFDTAMSLLESVRSQR